MNSSYEIFNASAGSGKTFMLTSRYLAKLLGSSNKESYRTILALTFTNKASEEMKNRILNSLKDFSNFKEFKDPSPIMTSVKDQLAIPFKEIHIRAKKRLNLLLHNYSFFNVSTLDSFSHNIIRSFAKELKISSEIRLILDSDQLMNESIERLLGSVGKNKEATKALIDFANSKISEGKSWDVTYDLKELSSIINNENHYEKIRSLENNTIKEFLLIKEKLQRNIKLLENQIVDQIKLFEDLIRSIKFEATFSRNSFPNFLQKLKSKEFKKINLESTRNLFVKNSLLTKKSIAGNEVAALDLTEKIFQLFEKTEMFLNKRLLLKAFYDSVVPVSVLNQIKKISKKIQNEKGELLISEFNKIISEEIKDQPAPYIFEKIGSRYNHYLIDEFQDTSLLQWKNLIPLISNSIESSENDNDAGSLLLVGDPKQSLYRWRGADPDKFISLLNKESPFSVQSSNKILPKNYRSCDEIVSFNNLFFKDVSGKFIFEQNKEVYAEGHSQELNGKKGGFVSLDFLEKKSDKQLYQEGFFNRTIEIIKDCKKRGFSYSDQSILVRNKKQQNLIAEFLIENEVPVISADALLIKNSDKVKLLVEFIRLRNEPENLNSRKTLINYLIKENLPEDVFDFYKKLLNEKIDVFFENFLEISYQDFIEMSFYKGIAIIQRSLGFDFSQDAHTQFFMDELFDFFLSGRNEKQFLDFWDKNNESLNVVMNDDQDAIQILTIHKSKGLEFPVIIYPFADSLTHRANSKRVWLNYGDNEKKIELLIPFNNTIGIAGKKEKDLYKKIQRQEELDNANILYVALTRAIKEVYILATLPGKTAASSHNESLLSFVKSSKLWEPEKHSYNWGKKNETEFTSSCKPELKKIIELDLQGISFNPKLNDFYEDDKIIFGKLFHKLLSKIEYSFQLDKEIKSFMKTKNIDKNILIQVTELVKKTVNNQNLAKYFTKKYEVICEKEIFTKDKQIIIPDRIVVSPSQEHTIIEYKTGEKRKEHAEQINKYAKTLRDMGLNTEKSILVYASSSIEVITL